MKAILVGNNVRANCPDCGTPTTFEFKSADRGEFGWVTQDGYHNFMGQSYDHVIYRLLRCAGCGRGGIAKIHNLSNAYKLESFLPFATEKVPIPTSVPEGIASEFREAETCAAFGAYRAASGLFRSVLEKTLKANGYIKDRLEQKIDQASSDGIITAARKELAHTNIRVLGNDVLHDEWRQLNPEEVEQSHHYTQRILEDFYDDRTTVEKLLKQAERIQATEAAH